MTVFAASSLREAVDAVVIAYEEATGTDVVTAYGASSALARQVALGAPADVVLLADRDWADWLVSQGVSDDAWNFAANRLVVLTRDGARINDISDLPAMLNGNVLAMAQIEAVPAGRYGREALGELGVWTKVAPQVIQAANVRAALRFVERGEAPFGIGYASDLVAFPMLKEAYAFPPDSHKPVTYAGVAVTPKGGAFLDALLAPVGQDLLVQWGFLPAVDLP